MIEKSVLVDDALYDGTEPKAQKERREDNPNL